MGITALISTLLGLIGGVVPDLIKEWKDQRQHRREVEFQTRMHELQLKRAEVEAGAKIAEAEALVAAEEVRATRESLLAVIEQQGKPTGVAWIDGFNALIRPSCAVLVMVLFASISISYVGSVLQQYAAGHIVGLEALAAAIFHPQIAFAFESVMGFLFGARLVRKSP